MLTCRIDNVHESCTVRNTDTRRWEGPCVYWTNGSGGQFHGSKSLKFLVSDALKHRIDMSQLARGMSTLASSAWDADLRWLYKVLECD